MPDILSICLIDPQPLIMAAFRSMGHRVFPLITGDNPFLDLPSALAKVGCVPDMVIQTETLAHRTLVMGLSEVDCPTLFWAMDPHLNAHWHGLYARLFDLTCSTQQRLIPELRRWGAPDVRWLPMFGRPESWVETADRKYDLAFVGRVSSHRPARQWMLDFLRKKVDGSQLAVEHSLSYEAMMALYRDSRIIPNESILGEVNFRLFEATSCGCLVLSQDLGDEQEALFEPGREFDTYDNAVELDEKLSLYMKNSRLVRTMGRAARERVLAEHLPIHRAQRLLAFAGDCVRNRVTGKKAEEWEGLVRAAMWEAGVLETSPMDVLARLSSLEPEADVAATIVRMLAVSGLTSALEANIRAILGSRLHGDSLDVNLVGTMAALRLDQWDLAKAFWYRQSRNSGRPPAAPPKTPLDILTLWAKELKRHGRVVRVGFSFDPRYNLPFSAVECLMTLLREEPEHLPTLKFLDSLLRSMAGFEQLRVGFLSILTLHERNDWRAAQEIALADLKSYRLESGLEELCLAQDLAARKGEMVRFEKALSARDKSGALGRRLATFFR